MTTYPAPHVHHNKTVGAWLAFDGTSYKPLADDDGRTILFDTAEDAAAAIHVEPPAAIETTPQRDSAPSHLRALPTYPTPARRPWYRIKWSTVGWIVAWLVIAVGVDLVILPLIG